MVNRSKAKGTWAETTVTRFARENGFAQADRLTLSGRYDRGDILLCPGVILEVKAGKAAQTASYGQILAWMEETRTEIRNAGADAGALVVQRQGMGEARVGLWEFWYDEVFPFPALACRTLESGLVLLRHSGWGDPLPE